ncbi:hypothetical protein D3C86_1158660 [compost metagenome]
MRADHIRDIQQVEAHFRGDIVRNGLREHVRHALFTQPALDALVEPPGGILRRDDHRHFSGVIQTRLLLHDIFPDEIEKIRSCSGLDGLFQFLVRGLTALNQFRNEGRIVRDRRLEGHGRGVRKVLPGNHRLGVVGGRTDQVTARDHRHEGVLDEGVMLTHGIEQHGPAGR